MYDEPSVVVIVVVVFTFCFYFIASNERGKIYIQKLNKYKYVQVQLCSYAKKREEKSQLMHELNGTERRQLRHFTWPDLWQIIQFIVKAQCLICEMTHRICFSFHCFCVCAFDSTIHSFIHSFVHLSACHFSWLCGYLFKPKHTRSMHNYLLAFCSVIDIQLNKRIIKNWFSNKKS